jgi:hypothetical protein
VERIVLNALPNECDFAVKFLTEGFRAQHQFGLSAIFAIVFGEADPPLR